MMISNVDTLFIHINDTNRELQHQHTTRTPSPRKRTFSTLSFPFPTSEPTNRIPSSTGFDLISDEPYCYTYLDHSFWTNGPSKLTARRATELCTSTEPLHRVTLVTSKIKRIIMIAIIHSSIQPHHAPTLATQRP